MTVGELTRTMTLEEERGWVEYHRLLNEEREAARKQAAQGSRAKGRR